MKLRTLVLGAICISGFSAFAQEASTPVVETGLNYTFTRINPGGSLPSYSANGGSAYVEYNLNRVVGLVADLGWRLSRFTPYVQTLVGGARFSNAYDPGSSSPLLGVKENSFAAAIGGGVDFKLTDHIALKPLQVEYFMTQLPSTFANVNQVQNNLRYSAGIVFRFGSK
jgi:opacity protein-like surface antigen